MKIMFVRTAAIALGKTREAMTFAHQVAKLVEGIVGKKNYVAMPIGGNPGRIAWSMSFDNMTDLETAISKLLSDADYVSLVESSAPYFMPGSVKDEMWMGQPS